MSLFKLIYLGDIFAKSGRDAVAHFVPKLREKWGLDMVFANCENAANGKGISTRVVKELLDAGVDAMTGGNHIYDVKEGFEYLQSPDSKILRPYNFSSQSPGKGAKVFNSPNGVKVGLMNIQGRVFMEPGVNLPFQSFDQAFLELQADSDIMILDMHAEATAEKRGMGWYVDGKVQLMVGTHTHVQTADEEILPEGTAYITDLGMCGPHDSVIGMKKEITLKRMVHQIPQRFEPADANDVRLNGIYCEIDLNKKKAVHIERICERLK